MQTTGAPIDKLLSYQYYYNRRSSMEQGLKPGDFLVFQLESGFAMMRLLAEANGIWHVTVYGDFFPDVESAEAAAADPSALSVNSRHLALTTRAFESTQTAAIGNEPLTDHE